MQKDLHEQLKEGPIFLLLGQNYLRLETGTDSFLVEVVRKYGKSDGEILHYGHILRGQAKVEPETSLDWMRQRCEHLPPPTWLKTVAKLQWNGVYTSAIDTIWRNEFEIDWRSLRSVVEKKHKPSDPRSPTNLVCTFLYSNIDEGDTERPPLTTFELDKRDLVATELLNRLPELVTPFGMLIIEGYAGRRDWLAPKLLFPIIDEIHARPTHIFSVTGELMEEFAQDDHIAELITKGRLVLHPESLEANLSEAIALGRFSLDEPTRVQERDRRIRLEHDRIVVPPEIWRQVTKVAMILDDLAVMQEQEMRTLTPQKEYSDFCKFLSESSVKPSWSGYSRKFAFQRDFEFKLYDKTTSIFSSNSYMSLDPIIVHGQTGSGKTIALKALAYRIRIEGKYPVLFIERGTFGPINTTVNNFCEWAENAGASACLIIWDGMLDIDTYIDLLSFLVSRGRKVVLVGSYYRLTKHAPNLIEAPGSLSEEIDSTTGESEVARFNTFLDRFNVSLYQPGERVSPKVRDKTFLVALWWLLPETRPVIKTGILKEVDANEQRWIRYASEMQNSELESGTLLGQKLLEKGLADPAMFIPSRKKVKFTGEELEEVKKFTGLIMVPGSLGVKVPLELIVRAMGKQGVENFIKLLDNFDIFLYGPEGQTGNWAITSRTQLEAWQIRMGRIGGPSYEIEYMQALLSEVEDTGEPGNNPQIQFAIDLLRAVRPKAYSASGDYYVGQRYFEYFNELATTLKELRETRDIHNPRLMLQEATLLRKYVIAQTNSKSRESDLDAERLLEDVVIESGEAQVLLKKAENVAREALDSLEEYTSNKKLKASILVELASNLGTRMISVLQSKEQMYLARELYKEIRSLILEAIALERENFYPVDVFTWVTERYVKTGNLRHEEKLDAEADILHIFEMVNPEDFDFEQRERFESRLLVIGDLFRNVKVSDEAFQALSNLGSGAGYYVRAFRKTGCLPGDPINVPIPKLTQREKYHEAALFLENNRQEILHDGSCLYLLLRLWWMGHTGLPIFYYEQRQVVPFDQDDWRYCFRLLADLLNSDTSYDTSAINYLYGLATFHLGDPNEAINIFRRVEREAKTMQNARRIRYNYLASTFVEEAITDGRIRRIAQPMVFKGRIRDLDRRTERGTIRVEKLGITIPFIPSEFEAEDTRPGSTLSFHIAFNFLGLIADPISRYEKHRRR